jgi:hypothetical protein
MPGGGRRSLRLRCTRALLGLTLNPGRRPAGPASPNTARSGALRRASRGNGGRSDRNTLSIQCQHLLGLSLRHPPAAGYARGAGPAIYTDGSIRHYLRFVEEFAQHFCKSPDKLGLEHCAAIRLICLSNEIYPQDRSSIGSPRSDSSSYARSSV